MFWYNFGCDLLCWLLLIAGVGEFAVCLALLAGASLGVFGYWWFCVLLIVCCLWLCLLFIVLV